MISAAPKMYLMLCQVPERETRKAGPKFILLEPTPKHTQTKRHCYIFLIIAMVGSRAVELSCPLLQTPILGLFKSRSLAFLDEVHGNI